ncbi:MAG: aa3-type cytochrome c oxidase subunit IV [Alphaproteobacteria bacterium]|nr:aa3-type cytochrome c oxidase subunit IV [Alphaproteobacteria bacterium]
MSETKFTVGTAPGNDYPEHERTYVSFIRFSVGSVLAFVLILVSLVGMGVIGGSAFYVSAAGLLLGFVLIAATLISGLEWSLTLFFIIFLSIALLPFA